MVNAGARPRRHARPTSYSCGGSDQLSSSAVSSDSLALALDGMCRSNGAQSALHVVLRHEHVAEAVRDLLQKYAKGMLR